MICRSSLAQLLVLVALSAPVLGACASEETPPLAPAAPSASALAGSNPAPPCTDKQVRECRVELGQQGTVTNCFVGLQLCTNGTWGQCLTPEEVEAQLTN